MSNDPSNPQSNLNFVFLLSSKCICKGHYIGRSRPANSVTLNYKFPIFDGKFHPWEAMSLDLDLGPVMKMNSVVQIPLYPGRIVQLQVSEPFIQRSRCAWLSLLIGTNRWTGISTWHLLLSKRSSYKITCLRFVAVVGFFGFIARGATELSPWLQQRN